MVFSAHSRSFGKTKGYHEKYFLTTRACRSRRGSDRPPPFRIDAAPGGVYVGTYNYIFARTIRSPIIATKRKQAISPRDATAGDAALDKDAWDLQGALSELVRAYQFRDRKRICYYDVSVTQCYAISAILAAGSMTLGALAAELYLDKSTASRVVDTLEDKGYVRRLVDPSDGRALKLEVTREGRALHSRIEGDLVNEMKQFLADFDPDVRQATARLMARFARAAKTRFSCATKPGKSGK